MRGVLREAQAAVMRVAGQMAGGELQLAGGPASKPPYPARPVRDVSTPGCTMTASSDPPVPCGVFPRPSEKAAFPSLSCVNN